MSERMSIVKARRQHFERLCKLSSEAETACNQNKPYQPVYSYTTQGCSSSYDNHYFPVSNTLEEVEDFQENNAQNSENFDNVTNENDSDIDNENISTPTQIDYEFGYNQSIDSSGHSLELAEESDTVIETKNFSVQSDEWESEYESENEDYNITENTEQNLNDIEHQIENVNDEYDEEDEDNHSVDSFESGDEQFFISSNNESILPIGNVLHIVTEILATEIDYINNLRMGMENYYTLLDDKNIPNSLKGHKYTCFNVIEKIYNFHEEIFNPALISCGDNVTELCEKFKDYIDSGHFYYYVIYAMGKPRSDAIVKLNLDFFKEKQLELDDKLGILSFLVQPIQRLSKYRLIIGTLLKELMKFSENGCAKIKSAMGACASAEKKLQNILDAANSAVSVNEIIVDEFTCYINVAHQGKFYKSDNFIVTDPKTKKKFNSKVFLFDKTLVYTKITDAKEMICGGYYERETMNIRFIGEFNKQKFFLFKSFQGNEELEFTKTEDNTYNWAEKLQEWIQIQAEKQKIRDSGNRAPSYVASYYRMSTINGINRDSVNSITSGFCSNRSSSTSFDSNEMSRASWIQRKDSEQLRNSEKYYLKEMRMNYAAYIKDLNINNDTLNRFKKAMRKIFKLHNETMSPLIESCDINVHDIFKLFLELFNSGQFNIYVHYAIVANEGLAFLTSYYENEVRDATLTIEDFVKLPIKRFDDYTNLINSFVKEQQKDNWTSEIFKTAAILGVKMKNMHVSVTDNFQLYSLNQTGIKIQPFRTIEYSSLVSTSSLGNFNHKILIMETGLILVRFKTNTTTDEEKFKEIIFHYPFSIGINLRGSKKSPKKINFDIRKEKVPGIYFKTQEKKTEFCNKLLELK